MDLRTERLLNQLTVGVAHMSPGSKPPKSPKPPKRRFWIRLGAATFLFLCVLFLTWLSPLIAPLTFCVLVPIYLVAVQRGFRSLRAIERAQAKVEADKRVGQPSHSDLLDQQPQWQIFEQYEKLEGYEQDLIRRKFTLAFSIGIAILAISTIYGVLPQPVRVLIVSPVFLAAWYLGKQIFR